MRMKDLEFNNQLEVAKVNQISKYKYFDIPKEIFEETFDMAVKKELEENEIIQEHDKLIQKYIVNEINNGNVLMMGKVIDYFSPIKTIIIKNQRYNLPKDTINSIYIKAIKLLKYVYDDNISINMNILFNMKYIINNNYIDVSINKMDLQIYEVSFLKKYIRNMKIDPNKFAKELEISNKELSMLVNGEKKASIDLIETICLYFDVESYEELKEKIEKELNKNRLNVEKIREKLNNVPKKEKMRDFIVKKDEKCYNLSFLKEYTTLYNMRKDTLAELFSCGVSKVDDILDGKIWIKESLMSDLYMEFRVKGFTEFKAKILSNINKYKLNTLKTKLKKFYDKYRTLNIKEESMIELMPKELLAETLNLDTMDKTDMNITKLLFKIGFSEDYTYDDISEILGVDKDYIITVHRNDLIKINTLLKESQESTLKLR